MTEIHVKEACCHRDIKPQNILKVGENWKIADFGCIKMFDFESTAYYQQDGRGTLNYLSPKFRQY